MKFFRDEYVLMKRQGARVKIHRKSWLKQLRVEYQPWQVCQAGQVHKIRKQILSTCITLFAISKLAKISQKCIDNQNICIAQEFL
jgi:hypothetical protein